jgi:DNA-binding phage protein
LEGDHETGKAVLRDYITATVRFVRLVKETGSSSKSLMFMLSPTGKPTACNLFSVLSTVQKAEGGHLAVTGGH